MVYVGVVRQQVYPTDLTDSQWDIIQELIPPAKPGGRPRSLEMRQVAKRFHFRLQVVLRPHEHRGFTLLPRRWVVERTFAWFNAHRRLSKDYEGQESSSEAMIYIAMIRIMLRRLARA